MTKDDLMTTQEVATLFRVTDRTVRRWVRDGKIAFLRPGDRTIRFRLEDIVRGPVKKGKK